MTYTVFLIYGDGNKFLWSGSFSRNVECATKKEFDIAVITDRRYNPNSCLTAVSSTGEVSSQDNVFT